MNSSVLLIRYLDMPRKIPRLLAGLILLSLIQLGFQNCSVPVSISAQQQAIEPLMYLSFWVGAGLRLFLRLLSGLTTLWNLKT